MCQPNTDKDTNNVPETWRQISRVGRGDQRGATGDRTEDQVEEVGLMRADHEKTAMLNK